MLRAASQPLRKIGLYSKESIAAQCNTRDLNVVQNGSITELHLKRDWNGNTLTQKTIKDLRISLQLMEEDIHSRAIMIRSKGDYFSRGADYLYLGHLGANKQSGTEEYFAALYDLIYYIGRMETPLIPLINGKAFGSAACLSNLATFSVATPSTRMAFPETSFGFIPTGGASYHLSRLPGEVGVYLALTGRVINGSDAVHLKFAYNFANLTDEFLCDLHSTAAQISNPIPSHKLFGEYYEAFKKDKNHLDHQNQYENWLELQNRIGWSDFYVDRRENVKMVYADLLHRESMRNDSWSELPGHDWRSHISPGAQNHIRNFENMVMKKHIWSNQSYYSLIHDLKAIYRCFTASTLSEAIERINRELEHGDKEWARDTFSRLSNKSPLALEATYRLIKEAKNLEWAECLDREFNVALKLAQQPDFHEGSIKILSRHPGVPQWKVNFPVPQNLIDELFTVEKTLDLEGVKPNQFLPVKEWYKTFASGPRHYLNETTTDHYYARMSFNEDVRSFLNDHDIDVRDPCVEASEVRKGFWNAEMYKRKVDEELDHVQRMAEDPLLKEFYINDRKKAINDLFTNEAEITQKINDLITKRFERKFEDRINTIFDRSRNARSLEKQEFFREVKDFIHRKHFLENEGNLEKLDKYDLDGMKADDIPMKIPYDSKKSFIDDLQRDIIAKGETNPNIVKYADLLSIEDYKSYFSLYHPAFLEKNISSEVNEVGKNIWDKFRKSTDALFFGNTRDMHKRAELDTKVKTVNMMDKEIREDLGTLVPDEVLDNVWLYGSDRKNPGYSSVESDGEYAYEGEKLIKELNDSLNPNKTAEELSEIEKYKEDQENVEEKMSSEENPQEEVKLSQKSKEGEPIDSQEAELQEEYNKYLANREYGIEFNKNEADKLFDEIIGEELTSEGALRKDAFKELSEVRKEVAINEENNEEEANNELESDSEWGIPEELPPKTAKKFRDAIDKFEKDNNKKLPTAEKIVDYVEAVMEGKKNIKLELEKVEQKAEKTEKIIKEPEYHLEDKGKPRETQKSNEEAAQSEEEVEAKADKRENSEEEMDFRSDRSLFYGEKREGEESNGDIPEIEKMFSQKDYDSIPERYKGMENWTKEDWNLHFALFTTKRKNLYHYGKLKDFQFQSKEDLDNFINEMVESLGNKEENDIESEETVTKALENVTKIEEGLKAEEEQTEKKESTKNDLKLIGKVRIALQKVLKLKLEETSGKEEIEKTEEDGLINDNILKEKYNATKEALTSKANEDSLKAQDGSNELSWQEDHDEDLQGFTLSNEENNLGSSQSSSGSSNSEASQSSGSSSEDLYPKESPEEMESDANYAQESSKAEEAGETNEDNGISKPKEAAEVDKTSELNAATEASIAHEPSEASEPNEAYEAEEANKAHEAYESGEAEEIDEMYASRNRMHRNDVDFRNQSDSERYISDSDHRQESEVEGNRSDPEQSYEESVAEEKDISPDGIGEDQHDIDIASDKRYIPRKPDEADRLQLEIARPDEEEREEIDNEFEKIDPLVVQELQKEIYIKTGINDINEGIKLLHSPDFNLNLYEMKMRRIEVIRSELKTDDNIYHMDPNKKRLKKLFGDLLIKPQLDDLDENVLGILELESLEEVLSEVERCRKEKTNPILIEEELNEELKDAKQDAEENEGLVEDMEDEKNNLVLNDFANRIMLDRVYLNAVLGNKSYLPMHLTFNEGHVKGLEDLMGLCNFSQSPKEWAEISLQRAIDDIFDVRAELELKMTRAELIAYDRSIEERFKPQNIKKDMLKQLSLESIAAYKTFDLITDEEREKNKEAKPAEFLQELQKKLNKNMDTRRIEAAKQLYRSWFGKTQVGKPKDHSRDYLVEDDLYEKFRNYDTRHEKYSKLPTTKEGFEKFWESKKYVKIRQRGEDHAKEREEVRELEHKMNRAAEIACTIENLLKSKKVREKVGPENVEFVKKIIADRDNLIF